MKRIALFVEGQAEAIFAKRLLKEMARRSKIAFREHKYGQDAARIFLADSPDWKDAEHVALIYDCSNDEKVKSEILDHAPGLAATGYSCIIGLRDLHPIALKDLGRLRKGQNRGLGDFGIKIKIVIAVQEIETWFLAEWRHFQVLDHKLTPGRVSKKLGFSIKDDDLRVVTNTPDHLDAAYQIRKLRYRKRKKEVQRTVSALDYEHLYSDVRNRLPELDELLEVLDIFLSDR